MISPADYMRISANDIKPKVYNSGLNGILADIYIFSAYNCSLTGQVYATSRKS